MINKDNKFLIIGLVLFLIIYNFFFIPFLHKREIQSIAKSVLGYWASGEYALGRKYWEDPEQYPAIYDVASFEIQRIRLFKQEGKLGAELPVILQFKSDELFSSGHIWMFELRRDTRKWNITKFYPTQVETTKF